MAEKDRVQSLANLAQILDRARSANANALDIWDAQMALLHRACQEAERQAAESCFCDPSTMLCME